MTTDSIARSPRSKGKRELVDFMDGKKLSFRKAVIAKCFECMNGYIDGMEDCRIKTCPLYPSMPYRPQPPKTPRKQPNQLSTWLKNKAASKTTAAEGTPGSWLPNDTV